MIKAELLAVPHGTMLEAEALKEIAIFLYLNF